MNHPNNENITVSGVLTMSWYSLLAIFAVCGCIATVMSRIESLLWSLVLYFVMVVVAAVITLLVYAHIFMDRVTLSGDGILQKNRLRTKTTTWDQIIQAGFMSDRSPRVLVLLRNNGSKRKANDANLFFYLRNTGKLIAVPDEPGVAELVAQCYGPLDFDLSKND